MNKGFHKICTHFFWVFSLATFCVLRDLIESEHSNSSIFSDHYVVFPSGFSPISSACSCEF